MSLEGFACSRKCIGVWTRSYWNNIGECYSVVVKESPIIIIFLFYVFTPLGKWKLPYSAHIGQFVDGI
jgi:hypothetical protein